MTDKKGFSVGMTVDPAISFKPLPDHVAFDLCRAYPVSGGNLLIHNTRNGKRAMVTPEVYATLVRCNRFKTLEDHTADIIKNNPALKGQQADIRKVLQTMLDSGIMLSAKSACEKLRPKAENRKDQKELTAPVVAILTWERPQALERLLESIVTNCNTEDFHRLYVIDDSRKTENIKENQALVKRFSSEVTSPVQYFGRTEQRSLVDELVKRLPEHEGSIRFLTDHSRWAEHWTTGLGRNLALLLSCGRRLVMMDDDAICEVYDPPAPRHNVTFSDAPREADFFGSEQEWAHLKQPINPDPINRHMRCLGLTFSEALTKLGPENLKPAGLANATALELSELQADSAVLITECGSLGCPGTSNNTWLPTMAPDSLNRMLASGEKTTHALGSRKTWSGRTQPHFGPRSNMSQVTGFDNCQMLPPYLPIMRGQDRLFGIMLDFVYPESVVLDYPWAVPHLPLPERRWRDRDLDFTPANSFPKLLIEKIIEHKSHCASASPLDRLAALSTWFNDMASASTDSLTSMYIDSRLSLDSELLQRLTALLAKAETAPVNWQNYLRNGIQQLNTDLNRVSGGDFEISGLPAALDGDALISFWKAVWNDFAKALKAWPDIREQAAKITHPT